MEERKTAAIVIGIIALIVIFFTVILPEIRYRSTHTISFKSCTVHYNFDKISSAYDVERAANNKLALCLCKVYTQKHDTAVARQIIKLFGQYENNTRFDSVAWSKRKNLDSIIKNKTAVFDTLISVD